MGRLLFAAVMVTLSFAFTCHAQSSDSTSQKDRPPNQSQLQDANASPTQSPVAPTDTKKSKKVWTNENLSDAHGPVSVVGNAKTNPKSQSSPGKSPDAKYVADTKKQLEKFQSEISDLDKQLTQLKSFSEGETGVTSGAVKINKSYNRDPLDVQMRELQSKRNQLQDQVDALLDEARKRGVEPGQLR